MPYPFFEARQPRMNLLNLLLTLSNQFLNNLLLLPNDRTELSVNQAWMQFTVHQRSAFVFLNIAGIDMTCHLNVLGESLLLEVPNGKLIGIGQEVLDPSLCAVVLQVVHQMGTVALDLLAAGDGAEHNLGKSLCGERTEADSTNWATIFYQGQGFMLAEKYFF